MNNIKICISISELALESRVNIFLNSVLSPFKDYFSSYETGQSVGGLETGEPEKKHLAHPQANLGLSHVTSVRLEPTPDTAVR